MRLGFFIFMLLIVLPGLTGQYSTVTALIIDDDQNIYLGSNTGLSKMEADSRQMTRVLQDIPVSALAWSKRHGIFAACNGNEIRTPDGATFLKLEDPDVQISCMMISGGQLWAGTNNGIYVVSIGRQEVSAHHTPQNSVLASAQINAIYVDGAGIKWIGTDRGVIRIEGEKRWRLYEENTRFTAITGNSEGAWLAGDTEMWLVDPFNRWTPTDVKEGLSTGEIRAVATDRQGRVYLLSDIFIQFDPYKDTVLPVTHQSASDVAQSVALAIDNNDKLWVATAQTGLEVIDPETAIVDMPLLGTLIVKHPSCAGVSDGSVEIKVQGGQPPYQFMWSETPVRGAHATGLSGGSYAVTVIDYTGSTYTDIADLMEPVAMQALIEEDREAEGFALKVNATGGRGDYTYIWNDGTSSRRIAVQDAGTYSVTVTDINGCSTSTAYALNETALSTPELDEETPLATPEEPIETVTVENLKVLEADELNVGQILRIEQLQFQADSSHIQPQSYAVLDGIYQFLSTNERIMIEVGGHTNGLPDHAYCDRLSSARARSVAEYIINKGIPSNRISYRGYGKRQPVATNQTVEGRRKNQRVEVKILQM